MGATRVLISLGLLHEWLQLPESVQVLGVEPGVVRGTFRAICEGDEVPDAVESDLIVTLRANAREWRPTGREF